MENKGLYQELTLSQIEVNNGQVEGLPANPRRINQEKYRKLVESIKNYPEMMQYRTLLVYPHKGKYVAIGGNMRLRALKELGKKKAHCIVLPENTPVERLQAYTVLDNNTFGEWDFSKLANEWDEVKLNDWGLDVWVEQPNINPFTPNGNSEREGIGDSDFDPSSLPAELQGVDIDPDDLPREEGDDKTAMERVIIVYPKDKEEELCALLGLENIDRVIYALEDLITKH